MSRPSLDGFWHDGEWRELLEPDNPATGRQLARLNRAGMLELVAPGRSARLTKGEAAYAINATRGPEGDE